MSFDFKKEFLEVVKKNKPNWISQGAITADNHIYTFGTDTKVLSTIFELIAFPLIKEVATKCGFIVEISTEQTVYPDFTLYKNKTDKNKIAIDIKSTYIKMNKEKKINRFGFTLGSYTSFLRNNTKNILYPYDEYSEHWIIGFVYTRADTHDPERVDLKDRSKIVPSYRDVQFFVQEKFKIAGETPGSGNTANIGSFKSANIVDFDKGVGPFAILGEKIFQEYWANYPIKKPRPYSNIKEFLLWREKQNK